MFNPQLNNCVDCAAIPALLNDIDCKLTEFAKNEYNNTIFMLNYSVPENVFWDLLNYKQILTYRLYNSNYTCEFTLDKIASKVKILKYK